MRLRRYDRDTMTCALKCLRCLNVFLEERDSHTSIDFFECPNCHRRYARRKGGNLTYRWLHPISLPLYTILFVQNPVARANEITEMQFPPDQFSIDSLRHMVEEIDLELESPTQQVLEILDNPQSEAECREFLRAFSLCLKSRWQ